MKNAIVGVNMTVEVQVRKVDAMNNAIVGVNMTVGVQVGKVDAMNKAIVGVTMTVGVQVRKVDAMNNVIVGVNMTVGAQDSQKVELCQQCCRSRLLFNRQFYHSDVTFHFKIRILKRIRISDIFCCGIIFAN